MTDTLAAKPPPTVTEKPEGYGLRPRRGRNGETIVPWVLMTPTLVLLALMTIMPTIYLLRASVRNDTLLNTNGRFVGLANYSNALTDPTFWHSLLITIGFVIVAVALEMLLGMALSLPLAGERLSSTWGTTLLLLPFAITPVVSAMIFKELLNPNYGWVDYYLGQLGLPAHIEWLSHPTTAWIALIGLDVWQWTPFVALILIAGIQSLPGEPREAAAIDGVSTWQMFWHITLPQLKPFIAIALVLRTIQAFKTFDYFKVMTGGGPGDSTEILNLAIYRIALQSFRIGAAAAIAILLLILLSLLVPALLRGVGRNADPEEA
jgi:multiple sugar transport system permease protein